jgi:hypothetical protein
MVKEITRVDYQDNYVSKKVTEIEQITRILSEARKWAFNIMGDEYLEQMHKRKKEEDYGGYGQGKFEDMQKNFGDWYASLDDVHRARLSKIIYNRIYNGEKTRWENGLMFPKESEEK